MQSQFNRGAAPRRRRRRAIKPIWLYFILTMAILVVAFFVMRTAQAPPEGPTGSPLSQGEYAALPALDPDDPFDAVMVDVGQGDCFILMSKGEAALIDAGDNGAHEIVLECLEAMGIEALDIVIGTHAHTDHIASMDEVIDALEIEALYMGRNGRETKAYQAVEHAAARQMVPVTHPAPGDVLTLGDLTITVLWPERDDIFANENNASLVLYVEGEGISLLLTGDMESAVEKELLQAEAAPQANVLKVAHHGSKSSSTEAFLSAVSPQAALISAGQGNRYQHPHDEVLERLRAIGAEIYVTADDGHIVLDVEDGAIVCHTVK